jgi:hypothetical protein
MSVFWNHKQVGCPECAAGVEHLCAPDPIDGHNTINDLPGISDDDMRASGYTQDATGEWIAPSASEYAAAVSGDEALEDKPSNWKKYLVKYFGVAMYLVAMNHLLMRIGFHGWDLTVTTLGILYGIEIYIDERLL